MKRYFTLITCEAPGAPYAPLWGDFNKAAVLDEMQRYCDEGYQGALSILETDGRLSDIAAAVAEFNRGKGLI